MENATKIELHYFFNDNSHYIDAGVRHKCETEILALIKEVSLQLNLPIQVETEAYLEGGLIDRWKLVANKPAYVAIVISIIGIILNRYPVSTANPELEGLNIQIAKIQLSNLQKAQQEARKAEMMENIKKELKRLTEEEKKEEENKKLNPNENNIESKSIVPLENKAYFLLNPDALDVERVINNLDTSIKVTRFKSNFYNSLNRYNKVTQISTTPLSDNNVPVEPPTVIVREQFPAFIIESDELPTEVIENAKIEIVSPVLRKGKYKWKGLYLGESIDFYMKDGDFKDSVYRQEVSFTTGIYIECILEIHKRVDDLGNINITNYSVVTVLSYTEGNMIMETDKGKKIRVKKEIDRDQTNLEFPQ